MSTIHRFATRAALLAGVIGLAGCATGARLERVMREDASGYVVVGGEEASSLVTVFRDGGSVAARPPLTLQPGDELETGAGGAAIVQLPDGGLVVIDARARVRIGSLEVLFGRVFAAVRGLFSVESENVVAGVEGTEFAFEVAPDRGVRVVVLEGVVVCTSKAGRWPPTRLRSGLGFASRPGGRDAPRVGPASPRELDDIRAWVRRVTSAARPGYCCDAGRVFASQSGNCRGAFYADRASAQRACATPPEPTGWCCDEGRVTSTTRARCGGAFYTDSASARKACASKPQPTGWCCDGKTVTSAASGRCRGKLYPDRASAERACAPRPQPTGWCCDGSNVTSAASGQCHGKLYPDRASAERACAQQSVGWCCLSAYNLQQMTAPACAARKGAFYLDEDTARDNCRVQ